MAGIRDGRGNDTLFPQAVTAAFDAAVYPIAPAPGPSPGPGPTPPGQIVQPKVLLAEWRLDSPGTVDLDNSLGVPVITAWRDVINGYELVAPSLAQAPYFVTPTNQPNELPGASFDGIDDMMDCLTMASKLNNLTGCSISARLNVMRPPTNTIYRVAWLESGAAGVPRFGYARSGIGDSDFYLDACTRDTDPVNALTGNVYEYDGWATHTARRDYLNGTAKIDWNGGVKTEAGGIVTANYGDSSLPIRFRLGAQNQGQNAGAFYIYGLRLYTYYISEDEMLADAQYYGDLAG